MAEESIFDISNKHLVGKMVFATKPGCRILSVEVPEIRNTFTVDYNDLKNNNASFYGDETPVFATNKSLWDGQFLMAAFAPDDETLERFVSQIKVNYSDEPEESTQEPVVLSQTWKDGSTEELSGKAFKSRFLIKNHTTQLLGNQRIFVSNRNGRMTIQLATQWPANVRNNVSSCLGLNKEDVVIESVPSSVAFDQLLTCPGLIAVAACAGSIKGGMDVEFSCPAVSSHPAVEFNITTINDEEGNVLKQISDISVDMGCCPVLPNEYANSIIAGVTPVYGLKAIETTVTILRSQTPPANFFGDLGYSAAIAACENHYTKLIKRLGAKQGEWRTQKANEGRIQKSVIKSTVFDKIQECVESTLKDSWFDRLSAVFNQKVFSETRVNPIINYNRGVAVACGQGSRGFSYRFTEALDYGAFGIFNKEEVQNNLNEENSEPKDYLFDSNTAACLVMALHIDSVMMIPVIDHVWAHVCYGTITDSDVVVSTLKQVINLTIKEICPCAGINYGIDLKFTQDPSKPTGSAQSLLRGLTITCFANAISQALSHDVYKLPVREQDVVGIVNKVNGAKIKVKQGEENAAEVHG